MKNVRFYQDFGTKKAKLAYWNSGKLKIAPNCLALLPEGEAMVALHDHHNSHVALDSVSPEYLHKYCVCCSEDEARLIHPNLFKRLDDVETQKKKAPKRKAQS